MNFKNLTPLQLNVLEVALDHFIEHAAETLEYYTPPKGFDQIEAWTDWRKRLDAAEYMKGQIKEHIQ